MKKLTKADFKLPALLIALSFAPTLGGVVRLISVSGRTAVTPDNARFLHAPTAVVIHVISATLYCLLGAFQFTPSFRLRWPGVHRRAGRVLALCGLLAGATGLWMTVVYRIPPSLQGSILYVVRIAVASGMIASIVIAWSSILHRRVARHEAFMIRAYALGQGAGTQVLVLLPWMLISGESGGTTRDLLMTLSWVINIVVAEAIIKRRARPPGSQPRGLRRQHDEENVMQTLEKTIIVAGGGYAGALAANRVHKRMHGHVRVLLITPEAQLTERIRLHQLAVHGSNIQQPYERLLAHGIEHVAARVVDVAPARNSLAIEDHSGVRWLEYDALILALGSGLTTRVPMTSPLSAALRDVAHARALSLALPKLAHGERVEVVGGGLSAIELASEIAEAFPHLSVELLAQRVGENLDEPARHALIEELEALQVRVREDVHVRALEHDGVVLQDGSHIPAALSVLACGFEPTPLPAASALPHASDGRVAVDAQLRVPGTENVFAVGDFAAPPPETVGSGLRSTRMGCVNAMPLGAHAADQVARLLEGRPLEPFHTSYMLQCISIGRRRGLVIFVDRDDRPTGRIVRGRLGALTKELICRFVIGGIRLERHFAGAYAWPEQHRPGMLSKTLEQLTP